MFKHKPAFYLNFFFFFVFCFVFVFEIKKQKTKFGIIIDLIIEMFLKNWHITSTLYTLLGFPLIFVVNPVCPCKPYKSPPSLSWDKLLDCVGEGREKVRNFCLKGGGGEGRSGRNGELHLKWEGLKKFSFVCSLVWLVVF